jgi:hypothetical protein
MLAEFCRLVVREDVTMAAVALALDEDLPDLSTTPLRTRSRRRQQKTRIRHH